MNELFILVEFVFPIFFIFIFIWSILRGKDSAKNLAKKILNKNIDIWKKIKRLCLVGIISFLIFSILMIFIENKLIFTFLALSLGMIGTYYYIGLVVNFLNTCYN